MAHEAVRQFYNEEMPKKFGDDYEYHRWFRNDIQKAGYDMTLRAIGTHVLSNERLDPARLFELGPGAGTWTKHLLARFPNAYVDLIDISKEMLARASRAIGKNEHVRLIETDILDWTPEGTYHFFFSSRVLEYIDNKKAFCEKIFSALEEGGSGFLITKMPHYARERLLGRTIGALHQGQIAPGALIAELRRAGFTDVVAYPVTVNIPLLRNGKLNRLLAKFLCATPVHPISLLFSESYCVLFRKP